MDGNPLVVANTGWAETIPEWIKQEIEKERLIEDFKNSLKKKKDWEQKVGLAEVCAYLYTASLTYPLSYHDGKIYLWVSSKLMQDAGKEVPEFAKEHLDKGLDIDEKRMLEDLRYKIYKRRGNIKGLFNDLSKSLKVKKRGK